MVLRQVELGVGLQMAGETRRRIFARINDEFPAPTTGRDMLTAWSMAGFASLSVWPLFL